MDDKIDPALLVPVGAAMAALGPDFPPVSVPHPLGGQPVARLVCPDHDLGILRQITDSSWAKTMLDIAGWTGLRTVAELLDAQQALQDYGVDPEHPDWDPKLLSPPHTILGLVALNSLGRDGATLLASEPRIEVWTQAIEAMRAALVANGNRHTSQAQAAYLMTHAARGGYTPQMAVNRLREMLDAGVGEFTLELGFSAVGVPVDILAQHGGAGHQTLAKVAEQGMTVTGAVRLLRGGMPLENLKEFVIGGHVTDPAQIQALADAGVHPGFLSRALAEGLPADRWPEVLAPLTPLVVTERERTWLSWRLPVSVKPGLYTLAELTEGGVAQPYRIAWDRLQATEVQPFPEPMRRALADREVKPVDAYAVWTRAFPYAAQNAAPEDRMQDVDRLARVVKLGAGAELLGLLVAPRSKTHLKVNLDQLEQLALLRPTELEVRYLQTCDFAADTWIELLRYWRRPNNAGQRFAAYLKDHSQAREFLTWLVAQPSREMFRTGSGPRTEALRLFAVCDTPEAVTGMHAEALYDGLYVDMMKRNVPAARQEARQEVTAALLASIKAAVDHKTMSN